MIFLVPFRNVGQYATGITGRQARVGDAAHDLALESTKTISSGSRPARSTP